MVTENAYVLHKELGEWMTDNVTVVRYNDKLTRNRCKNSRAYWNVMKTLILTIQQNGVTKVLSFTRQLEKYASTWHVLLLLVHLTVMKAAEHITNQISQIVMMKNFLKTTMAKFDGEVNAPAFHYEEVDVSLIKPRKRDYSAKRSRC